MLAAEFSHKARSAKIGEQLLRAGVPAYRVMEAVDLSKKEMDALVLSLGDAAPKPLKGKVPLNVLNLTAASVRRSICATVLVSNYKTLRDNSPDLGFAELFLHAWRSLYAALSPTPPGRMDMDARNAWSLLRLYQDGLVDTAACTSCGAIHPKIDHSTTKCIICYQLQFTNCGGCGAELTRSMPLHDKKWREGERQGLCSKCRTAEVRGRLKVQAAGWLPDFC